MSIQPAAGLPLELTTWSGTGTRAGRHRRDQPATWYSLRRITRHWTTRFPLRWMVRALGSSPATAGALENVSMASSSAGAHAGLEWIFHGPANGGLVRLHTDSRGAVRQPWAPPDCPRHRWQRHEAVQETRAATAACPLSAQTSVGNPDAWMACLGLYRLFRRDFLARELPVPVGNSSLKQYLPRGRQTLGPRRTASSPHCSQPLVRETD